MLDDEKNAIYLFQKAIFLKPELILKGREKSIYETLKSNKQGMTSTFISSQLSITTHNTNQVLKRLINKRLILRMAGKKKGYRYLAISPDISLRLSNIL